MSKPFRVLTLNVNGLRSAVSKGLMPWLLSQDADVICLQETRLQPEQREKLDCALAGYHATYLDAQSKGYSGVAIYARHPAKRIVQGIGSADFDSEGRWLQMDFQRLSVVSLYLPSGSSGELRQQFKFEVMRELAQKLKALKKQRVIICGDWNIAHTELDIKNWRGNKKNSGFLPEERAWIGELIETGWIDTHRALKPGISEYTWWSNRGAAYEKDVGWRIDYQFASPQLQGLAQAATVFRSPRFSDHAPLVVDYAPDIF
jgi:exodeoxyribonuclease III